MRNKFVDIVCDLHKPDKIYFYEDLYFKDKMKKLILKNCKKDKVYKISIYKYNHCLSNRNEDLIEYLEIKYDCTNVLSDIDNIENLNSCYIHNLLPVNPHQKSYDDVIYGGENDLENIHIFADDMDCDFNIQVIQNGRAIFKISETDLLSAGNFDKIPELFYKLKNLLIIKNSNKKWFIHCYIRALLNDPSKNKFKISKEDMIIVDDLEYQCNMSFDNVCISELNNIEDKLKVNIHIFGCNKEYKSKKIIRKSLKEFDKDSDLLLIDGIDHYILIKNLNKFASNNSHVIKTCRNCLNVFFSTNKYSEHIQYYLNRKPNKIIPSYKNI